MVSIKKRFGAPYQEVFYKKGDPESFANFFATFFLMKLQAVGVYFTAQLFSYELCKIFKKQFFVEHLLTGAFGQGQERKN